MKVTIYLETSMKGPAIRHGSGEWLIEYIKKDGTPETRQGIIKDDETTENALQLKLLIESMERLNRPCEIEVVTGCGHILNVMRNHWLPQWEKNDWKKSNGKAVKHADLWQQAQELMAKHAMTFSDGHNSYKSVMDADIKKSMEG